MIISNVKIDKLGNQITFNQFLELAGSDDGFDCTEPIQLNIEDVPNAELLNQLMGFDNITFFTTTEKMPSFVNPSLHVEVWKKNIQETVPQSHEDEIPYSVTDEKFVQEDSADMYNPLTGIEENEAEEEELPQEEGKVAKIYVFGSSKGGTGKTFTAVMSTYMYAKDHPDEKIAMVDFDIIDGQVGISIHTIKPTMRNYFTEYQKGYDDFKTMKNFSVKSKHFPSNIDFYLAPNNGLKDHDEFWLNVVKNCVENYDVVVFDTGIDYLNITPISYAYKIADKVNILTTTSLKSVNSVMKQIKKLKGDVPNDTYSKLDDIGSRLNVIITQMDADQSKSINSKIHSDFSSVCNVSAVFGIITDSVSRAEYYGEWDVFDKQKNVVETFREIMRL